MSKTLIQPKTGSAYQVGLIGRDYEAAAESQHVQQLSPVQNCVRTQQLQADPQGLGLAQKCSCGQQRSTACPPAADSFSARRQAALLLSDVLLSMGAVCGVQAWPVVHTMLSDRGLKSVDVQEVRAE